MNSNLQYALASARTEELQRLVHEARRESGRGKLSRQRRQRARRSGARRWALPRLRAA